jgi:hypothetical protein
MNVPSKVSRAFSQMSEVDATAKGLTDATEAAAVAARFAVTLMRILARDD